MTDVVMPQMGESIVEGTLTRWLKKVGEKVERDEPLFEISTDKVDTEIPSPAAGVLTEVLVQEGNTVGINTVVARIGDGAAGSAPSPQAAAPAPSPAPQQAPAPPQPQPSAPAQQSVPDVGPSAQAPPQPQGQAQPQAEEEGETGPLSPLVRKMAREYNIDLSQVRGTGVGGRITKQDVEAYMASQAARTVGQAAPRQYHNRLPPPPDRTQPPRLRSQRLSRHLLDNLRRQRLRLLRCLARKPRKHALSRCPPCAAKLPSTWYFPNTHLRTSPPCIAWT